MTTTQLRERIVTECFASLREAWMDAEIVAELRQRMRADIDRVFDDEKAAHLLSLAPEEELVTALSTVIAAQLRELDYFKHRETREKTAAELGIGPKHGRN